MWGGVALDQAADPEDPKPPKGFKETFRLMVTAPDLRRIVDRRSNWTKTFESMRVQIQVAEDGGIVDTT